MTDAPNCPISRPQPIGYPGGIDVITNVPAARDLRSVITAINMMSNIVQHITRGAPQINNIYPTNGIPPPTRPTAPQYARYTWQEKSRSYQKQKVYNVEDKDQFVEIMTLAEVQWAENTTGHTLTYRRK